MLYLANKLFNEDISSNLRKRLILCSDWVDGKVTANKSAPKRNLQLNDCEEKNKNYQ